MSNISKRTYDLNDIELETQIKNLKDYINSEIDSIEKPDVNKEYVDAQLGDIQSVLEAINAQINTFKGGE